MKSDSLEGRGDHHKRSAASVARAGFRRATSSWAVLLEQTRSSLELRANATLMLARQQV